MKKGHLIVALVLMIVCLLAFAVTAMADYPAPSQGVDQPIRASKEETAVIDEENAPKVTEFKNGIKIQRTPYDTTNVYGRVVSSWNNLYKNADNRGCLACHTLEQALDSIKTFHGAFYMGYDTELTVATCLGCHGYETETVMNFRDSIHTTHFTSDAFNAMKGNCESCHYIDAEGDYQLWDNVKYDVLHGIADLSADTVDATITYNQDEITPVEKMFYKNPKSESALWVFTDEQVNQDIYDNWTITVEGDIDNPFTMTLSEMVEKFGTVTQVMKANCVINGIGASMIYQAEVTGIPMAKVIEYAQAHEDANLCLPTGDDGYVYQMYTQEVIDLNGILVLEMNGQPIPAGQGYPVAYWAENMSCGNFSKRVNKIQIVKDETAPSYALYGWVVDPDINDYFNKPNMGVLSAPSGVIYKAGEAIHLEGYADAWDEPIIRLEYSFDHGATWKTVETTDTNTVQWVYWKLDLNNELAAGSYLVKMRATSLRADGTERTMAYTADFMFNVQ